MKNDASDSWLKFLNPESLKENLIRASLYLTCWEMLKECIMEQPRSFISLGWNESGEDIPSPEYKADVLSRDKDPLIASALWFRERDVISDDDIILLKALRAHRNEIAHELPKFLGTTVSNVKIDFFNGIFYLVQKIDKWWIQEIEIPTNPEFDNRELTPEELDGVQSARMLLMSLLIPIADGKDDQLRTLYEEFKIHVKNIKPKS